MHNADQVETCSKQKCFLIAFPSTAAAKSLVIQVSSHSSNCTSARPAGDTITLGAREDEKPFLWIHLKASAQPSFLTLPGTRKLLRFVWLLLERAQPGEGHGQGLGGAGGGGVGSQSGMEREGRDGKSCSGSAGRGICTPSLAHTGHQQG